MGNRYFKGNFESSIINRYPGLLKRRAHAEYRRQTHYQKITVLVLIGHKFLEKYLLLKTLLTTGICIFTILF